VEQTVAAVFVRRFTAKRALVTSEGRF